MTIRLLFFLAVGALLLGCSPEPEPIQYGNDACSFCRMTISDARYGAELVTSTGKVYTFDAIECLAAYVEENAGRDDLSIHSLWVSDYARPGTLVNVEDAFFVHGGSLRSPMAMNVAAFSRKTSTPAAVADSTGGMTVHWADVRDMAARGWAGGDNSPGHHHTPASESVHGSNPMPAH